MIPLRLSVEYVKYSHQIVQLFDGIMIDPVGIAEVLYDNSFAELLRKIGFVIPRQPLEYFDDPLVEHLPPGIMQRPEGRADRLSG